MNNAIRAWKDPIYRSTLSAAEQAMLASPAGMIDLTGTDLEQVAGGCGCHCGHHKSHQSYKKSGKSKKSK
jgi:mersacidin/lichenicidin family type 2 lantibiotic